MPWVILAAALCVLVWFWPRNTLIGLAVVGTAGVLAGIAFWMNGYFRLTGDDAIDKKSPLVARIKEEVDRQYADGRNTAMGDQELEEMLRRIDFGEYERLSHIHLKEGH